MPPQDPNQTPPDSQQVVSNPLAVMQPGEQVLFELKRHPIGILGVYVMTGLLLAALAVIAFGVVPGAVSGADKSQVTVISGMAFVIFALICLAFNLISTVVYWGNRWILTDDSITQITQTGLFKKETSSLGIESLEDVTAEKNGIFAEMFNYGVLKAETAGHRSKFVFTFCPNPNQYAKQILEAKEKEDIERQKYGQREDDYQPTQAPGQPAPPQPPTSDQGFRSNL